MPRTPKPWYWKARKSWFVTISGRRHNLGPDKLDAEDQFHQLILARRETTVQEGSLAEMLDRFYLYCAEDKKPSTAAWYKKYLEDLLSYLESKRIRTDQFEPQKLRPKDVRNWADDRGTAKRPRITTIKAAYSWGYAEGWITSNPIGGMKRGKEKKRKQVIPVADMRRILRLTSDKCFRELLIVSWDTGARPQEITKLTSSQVELSKLRCVLETEDSKGERFCRVIYLTPRAERIIARNSVDHDGIVFRNTDGNPWTANAVRSRFRRLTDKVGTRYRQYDFRHTFATRLVKAGVSPIVVAELLGHEDTSTLAMVYQHVAQDPETVASLQTIRRPSAAEPCAESWWFAHAVAISPHAACPGQFAH